jgi:spore maturation protein CgeB
MKILIYDADCMSSGIKYPLKSAFEQLGHQVTMFDWTKYFFNTHRFKILRKISNLAFKNIIEIKINKDFLNMVQSGRFDIILVMRGENIFPNTLLKSKKYINKLYNWNTDDLFNKLNSSNHILNSIHIFDTHFTPRMHLEQEYINKGAVELKKMDWYYRYGLDYNKFRDIPEHYKYDVSFIGSWSNRREEFLSLLINEKLKICGWGWGRNMGNKNASKWEISPHTRIDYMHELFYISKININILTIENRDVTNFRNFEIPAAGGFQLAERSKEVLELFEEDKEIVCFSSPEELYDKYKFYLKNETTRLKILYNARKRVFTSGYSLVDRAKSIINHFVESQ